MTAGWLILGGGVAGLTLAATLAQHHLPFVVLEKDAMNPESGAGLLLAPNATRILTKLGLLDQAIRLGHKTHRWRLLNQSGSVLRELGIDSQECPPLSIHRGVLLELLRANLPMASVRTGFDLAQIQSTNESVTVAPLAGSPISGVALIGADGLRSSVRQHIFGDRPLRYRGYVGWRGVAPFLPSGYEGEVLSESWGPGGRFGIAPLDSTRTYWYASANHPESWIDSAAERQSSLLKRFGHWHEPISRLIAATPSEQILVSRIYDGPKLAAWSSGRVALLGDAAHAMTPNLGQGACLAMEDAWVLGACIARLRKPEAAFRAYQQARRARAHSIQRQSRAMGWVVQAENPLSLSLRAWLTPRLPNVLIERGMRSIFRGPVDGLGS